MDYSGEKTTLPDNGTGDFLTHVTIPGRRDRKSSDRIEIGDLIMNRYKVLAELGQGGMGIVYKCFDETAGIEIALKALPQELSRDSSEMEEIKENFQLVSRLIHQNIAVSKNLEKDTVKGTYYLIMECVNGEDLRHWSRRMKNAGTLHPQDVVPIIRQVAEALDYAHKEKIIHRDIKPSNVMILRDHSVKVLDFGLAAQFHSSLTRVTAAMAPTPGTSGTGPYMAPEQWMGRTQGAPSDQYALAVMTYELMVGHLPFVSSDLAVLQQAILTQAPHIPGNLPLHVRNALKKALSKNPNKRFNSCVEFADALEGRGFRREKNLWGLLAVALFCVLAAILGAGGYVMFYGKKFEEQSRELAIEKMLRNIGIQKNENIENLRREIISNPELEQLLQQFQQAEKNKEISAQKHAASMLQQKVSSQPLKDEIQQALIVPVQKIIDEKVKNEDQALGVFFQERKYGECAMHIAALNALNPAKAAVWQAKLDREKTAAALGDEISAAIKEKNWLALRTAAEKLQKIDPAKAKETEARAQQEINMLLDTGFRKLSRLKGEKKWNEILQFCPRLKPYAPGKVQEWEKETKGIIGKIQLRQQKIESFQQNKMWDEAEAETAELKKLAPQEAEQYQIQITSVQEKILSHLAVIEGMRKAKKWNGMNAEAQKLTELSPKKADKVFAEVTRAMSQIQVFKKRIADFRQAKQWDKMEKETETLKALAPEEAQEYAKEIAVARNIISSHLNLIAKLREIKDWSGMIAEAGKLEELSPEKAKPVIAEANLAIGKIGKLQKEITAFRKIKQWEKMAVRVSELEDLAPEEAEKYSGEIAGVRRKLEDILTRTKKLRQTKKWRELKQEAGNFKDFAPEKYAELVREAENAMTAIKQSLNRIEELKTAKDWTRIGEEAAKLEKWDPGSAQKFGQEAENAQKTIRKKLTDVKRYRANQNWKQVEAEANALAELSPADASALKNEVLKVKEIIGNQLKKIQECRSRFDWEKMRNEVETLEKVSLAEAKAPRKEMEHAFAAISSHQKKIDELRPQEQWKELLTEIKQLKNYQPEKAENLEKEISGIFRKVQLHSHQAKELAKKKKWKDVQKEAEELAAIAPKTAEPYRKSALEALQQIEYHRLRSERFISEKKWEELQKEALALHSYDPDTAKPFLEKAGKSLADIKELDRKIKGLYDSKKFKEANGLLEELALLSPQKAIAWKRLIDGGQFLKDTLEKLDRLREQQKWEEMIAAAEKLKENAPENFRAIKAEAENALKKISFLTAGAEKLRSGKRWKELKQFAGEFTPWKRSAAEKISAEASAKLAEINTLEEKLIRASERKLFQEMRVRIMQLNGLAPERAAYWNNVLTQSRKQEYEKIIFAVKSHRQAKAWKKMIADAEKLRDFSEKDALMIKLEAEKQLRTAEVLLKQIRVLYRQKKYGDAVTAIKRLREISGAEVEQVLRSLSSDLKKFEALSEKLAAFRKSAESMRQSAQFFGDEFRKKFYGFTSRCDSLEYALKEGSLDAAEKSCGLLQQEFEQLKGNVSAYENAKEKYNEAEKAMTAAWKYSSEKYQPELWRKGNSLYKKGRDSFNKGAFLDAAGTLNEALRLLSGARKKSEKYLESSGSGSLKIQFLLPHSMSANSKKLFTDYLKAQGILLVIDGEKISLSSLLPVEKHLRADSRNIRVQIFVKGIQQERAQIVRIEKSQIAPVIFSLYPVNSSALLSASDPEVNFYIGASEIGRLSSITPFVEYTVRAVSPKGTREKVLFSKVPGEQLAVSFDFSAPEPPGQKLYTEGISCLNNGDERNAKRCFAEASKKGHPEAAYQLAELYRDQLWNPFRAVTETAEYWYRKAAEAGKAEAMYEVAVRYAKNSKERLEFLHRAAGKKYGPAAFALYEHYMENDNPSDAKKYLNIADKAKIPKALYLVGLSYLEAGVHGQSLEMETGYRKIHDAAKRGCKEAIDYLKRMQP